MDTLHTMLRALKRERKSQHDRITVFREFLDQLERFGRRTPSRRPSNGKRNKPVARRNGKT